MSYSIDEFLKQYRTAVADAERAYPWLAKVVDNYGQLVSQPSYAIDWADTQENAYGIDPTGASLLTEFGIPPGDPAATAAGLAGGASAANTGGANGITQPRVTGGGNQPWSPYTSQQTNQATAKDNQYDQDNNLPTGVQTNLDVVGGRGTSKPLQRGMSPDDVANLRRGWIGQGPVKAEMARSFPEATWRKEVRRGTPTARQNAVDLPDVVLPEGTRMNGVPGTKVMAQIDGNWQPATFTDPRNQTTIPLIYNANGRPSLGATNDDGTLLISPMNGRFMTAGLSGEAIDVMTGQSEFEQSWLHKLWFGDAGEDGVINSGDERTGEDWWGGVYTGIKWMGRAAFLELEANKRRLDAAVGKAFGNDNGSWADVWANTPSVLNFERMWNIDQTVLRENVGDGWGAGGTALRDREDYMVKFGLTPGGKSWSIGVGAARAFGMDVDKGPGSAVSGLIDATALIVTDPTTWIAPEVKLLQVPKAFAVGAKQGARVLTPGMKGRRWQQAKDAYAYAAITASGGGDTGRLFYVPGSRLASRFAGRDVYWGLKPVGRPREMEVSADAASRYAREGMEGLDGSGPLDTTIGSDLIASYTDDELAEMPEARRALIDDRTRVSLPSIGSTASTANTPFHYTDDAAEWAGSLWFSSDSPSDINRLLDISQETPLAGQRVEYPVLDEASTDRYFDIDELLDRFGVDADVSDETFGMETADALNQIKAGGAHQHAGAIYLGPDGLALAPSTVSTLLAMKRLGMRKAALSAVPSDSAEADWIVSSSDQYEGWRSYDYESLRQHDSDVPWWMEDEAGETVETSTIATIVPHVDIDPLFASGSTNPLPAVDVNQFNLENVAEGLWRLQSTEPYRLSTSPRHRNSPDSQRPGQLPWLSVELEPRGIAARINFDSPKMLLDEYRSGWTDMIEPIGRPDPSGQLQPLDRRALIERNLRAVYVNRNQIEYLRQTGKWTPEDEEALRNLDDTLIAIGGRHAQGGRQNVLTKFRGVGKWEGWEVHRADGVADSAIVPVSPFQRTPDGAIIIPPGGERPIRPAGEVADTLRVTMSPEDGGVAMVSGKRVDMLGHSERTGQHFQGTNRTLSGEGTDPTQVQVTIAPLATDQVFAGVADVPGARARTVVDPTVDDYTPTVPRKARKPEHVRGTTLAAKDVPEDLYVVGDVMGQHLSGGAFKPRVPTGTPDELGDKGALDMSRRRGNIRLYSDMEGAFRYQSATRLLARLARSLPGPGQQQFVYSASPKFPMGSEPVAVALMAADARRQVEALFGPEVAADFAARAKANRTLASKARGLSEPMWMRDGFSTLVEEPLMRALYGEKFDADDLLGKAKWEQVDPTKIEVGAVDGNSIVEGGASLRRYEDSGADIRVYGPVRPTAILRDTGVDAVAHILPNEPYERLDMDVVADLREPPVQTYARPGEEGRVSDNEIDLNDPTQFARALERMRKVQEAEGTLPEDGRPRLWHATQSRSKIATDGRVRGSTGGGLGGTMGKRGISITFSGMYADAVRNTFLTVKKIDDVWRSQPTQPLRIQALVRWMREDLLEASGNQFDVAEELDALGFPQAARIIAGEEDIHPDDMELAMRVARGFDTGTEAAGNNGTWIQTGMEEDDWFDALIKPRAKDDALSYLNFREALAWDEPAAGGSFATGRRIDSGSIYQDAGVLGMLNEHSLRQADPSEFDVIEWDAEELLGVIRDSGHKFAAKRFFDNIDDPDNPTMDWEAEVVSYGDITVPTDWRMEVLGGRTAWVDPEVKYSVVGSQDSLRRAATEIELPHQSMRVGGQWDKRGVQRMWGEFEQVAPTQGWTQTEIKRPRLGAKPIRTGPDGRPEYADDDLVDVVKWTAPFTRRTEGTQEGIEDLLNMGPIERQAQDGVVNGQSKVLVPAGFHAFMEVGGGAKLIERVQDDDLLSMLKRLNGHVDVTILGRIQRVKKEYAALRAEPGADLDTLRRDEAKAIRDEFTIGASQGLWEGNPKSYQWRKGWKPRLLETIPGQSVLITDPNAAMEQLLRWGSAARLSPDAMTRMADEMLEASTPEGRASILEGVTRGVRHAIIDVQFRHAPRQHRSDLGLLSSLPDDALSDVARIRQHMIDNGADPSTAGQSAKYAAAIHSTALKATRMWNKSRDEATTYLRDLVARGDAEVRGPDGEPAAIPDSLLLAELVESTVPMPEPRDVMRLTSRLGSWAQYGLKQADRSGLGFQSWLQTKAGKVYESFVDTFLENYTQSLFKPLVLLRGAYVARVLPEEQARLWASGWVNSITRPLDYWLVTSGKKNTHMIDGRPWDAKQAVTDNEPNLYAEAVGMRFRMSNTRERASQAVKSFERRGPNDFSDPEMKDYGYGYAVTLANLHFDPIVRRLAGGWKPSDLAEIPADIVSRGNNREMMSAWIIGSETGRRYLRAFVENQRREPDLSSMWAQTPEGVEDFLDDMDAYLQVYARGDLELLDVVASGKYEEKPITRTDRWTDLDPNFAEWTTRLIRNTDRTTLPDVKVVNKEWQSQHDSAMKRVSDAGMKLVIGLPTQTFSRSPLFRTRYVDHVIDLLPIASQNAKQRLLAGEWMKDLTGQQRRRLEMAMKDVGDTDGAVQWADLDMVAKGRALSDVTGTLYDFGTKTVLSDALRNISPFFTAWTEAIGVWSRLFANNPRVFSRLNMVLQGGQQENALDFMYNEDERYAGQGFFWKDPTTKDLKFTYPFSDMGATFPLTGNVANLNMVATLTPGLGPTVTMPAAALLRPNTPNDTLYNLRRAMTMVNGGMAPSNDPVNMMGLPSWSKNFIAAYAPAVGGSQTNSMWANAKADALRFLSSSDTGMLTDRDLDAKANDLARESLLQRGFAQFFLPTVADHRATALSTGRLTSGGQMIEQSVISDQYRQYQDRYGFNEGNVKFFQDFGMDGFIAAGGVNEYDGYLDYTATQWHFIRTNPELTSRYRDVIGLIAPPSEEGEGFNFDAYRYSQDSGMRQPKTSAQYQADIQTRLARMVMNQAEARGMSADGRKALRQELHRRFPLYTDFTGGAESRAQSITELYEAANDARVPEEVRRPLTAYLQRRDEILVRQGDQAGHYNPAWDAKKRQNGARELYAYGLSLAQTERGFTRAWKYLFSRELEGALS